MNTLKSHLLNLISSSSDLLNGALQVAILVVESVDIDKRTALCHNFEGVPFPAVSLQVPGSSVFLYPKPGSLILCVLSELSSSVYPLMYTALVSAEVVIGDVSAVFDADGFRIATKNMSAHINNDDIVFNGGNLNGLVIIQDLTDKLNNLVSEFNAFVKVFNSHIHTTTATIGPGTIPGVLSAPTASASDASNFSKDDYENTKIKQ